MEILAAEVGTDVLAGRRGEVKLRRLALVVIRWDQSERMNQSKLVKCGIYQQLVFGSREFRRRGLCTELRCLPFVIGLKCGKSPSSVSIVFTETYLP